MSSVSFHAPPVHLRGLRQDIAHVVRLLDRHRRMVEMICWHLMASVIAVAVAFRAGLLALLRDVGIKPEVIGSRLVARSRATR